MGITIVASGSCVFILFGTITLVSLISEAALLALLSGSRKSNPFYPSSVTLTCAATAKDLSIPKILSQAVELAIDSLNYFSYEVSIVRAAHA